MLKDKEGLFTFEISGPPRREAASFCLQSGSSIEGTLLSDLVSSEPISNTV
jgi:hypothetical protein